MYRNTLIYFFLFLFSAFAQLSVAKSLLPEKMQQEFARMQQGFEPNEGQFYDAEGKDNSFVLFRAAGEGVSLYLTEKGISYVFSEQVEGAEWRTSQLDLDLKGAQLSREQVTFTQPLSNAVFNYYYGKNNHTLFVKRYQQVKIENVYPGIDWIWYYTAEGIKYDFVVHPQADPAQIQLEVKGHKKLKTLLEKSALQIETKLGAVQEGNLYCYQTINGQPSTINSSYSIKKNTISFQLDTHDSNSKLIIDPPLTWTTFFGGGTGGQTFTHADVDDCGNIFAVGYNYSDMPLQDHGGGAYFRPDNQVRATSPFIAKFCSNGKLLWATHYCADYIPTNVFINMNPRPSRGAHFNSVVVDHNGDVVGVGRTVEEDWPTMDPGGGAVFRQPQLYDPTTGQADAFVVKFTNLGVLVWGTAFGGIGITGTDEIGHTVDVDSQNNIFIAGYTGSYDYPTMDPGGGAYYQTWNGVDSADIDAYIAKFTPGGVLQWSTRLGGTGQDVIYSLGLDAQDNLYAVGYTRAADFPLQDAGGYYQNVQAGNSDAFIMRFDPNGVMNWSTYYGGASKDELRAICFDSQNNLIVGGNTTSDDLPTHNPGGTAYFDGAIGITLYRDDIMLLKFDVNTNQTWGTYFGGDDTDKFDWKDNAIACDQNDHLFVVASSRSTNMTTVDPGGTYFQAAHGGSFSDAIILEFANDLQLLWSTYFGGAGKDAGCGVVRYKDCVFAFMNSDGDDLTFVDPGAPAFHETTGNTLGAYPFLARFGTCPNELDGNLSKTNIPCGQSSGGTAKVTMNSGGCEGAFTYSWSNGGKTEEITGLTAGWYTVTVMDICENTFIDSIEIPSTTNLLIDSLDEVTICMGTSVTLDPTIIGGTPTFNYDWNNGASTDSTFSVSPADTTTYVLKVTDAGGCEGYDTVTVNVVPEVIGAISPDATICAGDSVQLVASGGATYQWTPSNGLSSATSATPMASPTTTTTYQVTVSAGSCPDDIVTVTVEVVPNITATVSPDIDLCEGQDTTLTASGGVDYQWSTGDSTESIGVSPTTNTTYTVIVSAGSCGSDTAIVNVNVSPAPVANAGMDQDIQLGQSIDLITSGSGTYAWSPSTGLSCTDCLSPTASPSVTTTYILTITNGACFDRDTVTINVENTCGEFFVPNAFSPNGDGLNDEFRVRNTCITSFSMIIFDRWGKKVFETENPEEGWDGTYPGDTGNTAVFDYTLKATLITGEVKELKGNVVLVR